MAEVVFSLDIHLSKIAFKMPVLNTDSLNDLVQRLLKVSAFPQNKSDNIADKLTQQLRLILKANVSQKVKETVEELLYHKSEKREPDEVRNSEGKFTIFQKRIPQVRHLTYHPHRHFTYLQEQNLNIKYPSRQNSHMPMTSRSASKSSYQMQKTSKSPKCMKTSIPQEDLSAIYLQRYEQLDKKCDQFIFKHITGIQQCPDNTHIGNRYYEYNIGLHHRCIGTSNQGMNNHIDAKFRYLNVEKIKGTISTDIQKSQNTAETQRTTAQSTGNCTKRARKTKKYNYFGVEPSLQ